MRDGALALGGCHEGRGTDRVVRGTGHWQGDTRDGVHGREEETVEPVQPRGLLEGDVGPSPSLPPSVQQYLCPIFSPETLTCHLPPSLPSVDFFPRVRVEKESLRT